VIVGYDAVMFRQTRQHVPGVSIAAVCLVFLQGCVIAPPEAADEQAKAAAAGKAYATTFEQRELPELPLQPTWAQVLHRSLLSSGELEAAYHEWAAAVARIDQAGSFPNTPLSLGFGYMFSAERMKSFDRATFTAAPDAMDSLALPPKVYQAAKVALDEARASGTRFVAVKFELQRKVLVAWYSYALQAERVRIRRGHLALLGLIRETAAGRVRAGGAQVDMLRADLEYQRAQDELLTMEAELPRMQAMLNALAGRPPQTSLEPADNIPTTRTLAVDDAELLLRAAQTHPALLAIAQRAKGRTDALELARLQFLPDINPTFAFTGTVSQAVGMALSIPAVMPKVRAMVREAEENLQAVEAMRRQARWDHSAEVVATLHALRNSERQAALFDAMILPAAQRIVDNIREGYSRGSASFIDLVEAQRTLLDARLTAAEARAAREMRLAELESMIGVDAEVLAAATTQPATAPAPAHRGPTE
jgi:outer membrane protein TolC